MRASIASLLLTTMFNIGANPALARQKTALDEAKDHVAITQTFQRFLDSWNRHNAHANALTYTEDADVTNVLGNHIHGRPGIETASVQTYAGVFKTSHLTGQIRSIRFLVPGLVAVDVDWEMTGVVLPNGTPVPHRRGLMDWVMAKQVDGSWLIEVFHNTEFSNPPAAAK